MTETHPHNTDQARAVNGLTSAENEAAPSAAKRTASAFSTVNAAAV